MSGPRPPIAHRKGLEVGVAFPAMSQSGSVIVGIDNGGTKNNVTVLDAEGRFLIDRANRLVQLQLSTGTQHTMLRAQPEQHQMTEFQHLSLTLGQRGFETRAIWFGSAGQQLPEPPWDIAYELTRNEYLGRVSAQVQVVALRAVERWRRAKPGLSSGHRRSGVRSAHASGRLMRRDEASARANSTHSRPQPAALRS